MADPSTEHLKYATKTSTELDEYGMPIKKQKSKRTIAGSYSKPKRAGYENMLEEAGNVPTRRKKKM